MLKTNYCSIKVRKSNNKILMWNFFNQDCSNSLSKFNFETNLSIFIIFLINQTQVTYFTKIVHFSNNNRGIYEI